MFYVCLSTVSLYSDDRFIRIIISALMWARAFAETILYYIRLYNSTELDDASFTYVASESPYGHCAAHSVRQHGRAAGVAVGSVRRKA